MSTVTNLYSGTPSDGAVRRRRGWLWVVVVVSAIAAVAWSVFPLPDASARFAAVPLRGPGFTGVDVPLTPSERAAFGRVNVQHRRYDFGGRIVFLTLLDGTRDRHVVHDPSFCFRGAGWQVQTERAVPLPRGAATWVAIERAGAQAQAVYWFDDGATRHASPPRYWWQTTLRRLTFGRAGDEPALYVLQAVGPDQPDLAALTPEMVRALAL
jgi:hypothetical protein